MQPEPRWLEPWEERLVNFSRAKGACAAPAPLSAFYWKSENSPRAAPRLACASIERAPRLWEGQPSIAAQERARTMTMRRDICLLLALTAPVRRPRVRHHVAFRTPAATTTRVSLVYSGPKQCAWAKAPLTTTKGSAGTGSDGGIVSIGGRSFTIFE